VQKGNCRSLVSTAPLSGGNSKMKASFGNLTSTKVRPEEDHEEYRAARDKGPKSGLSQHPPGP